MADIELVIKIPEESYKKIKEQVNKRDYPDMQIGRAIADGTPLPKDHGRIIDADKLKLTQHDIHVEAINYRHRCISIENIDEAPTIIEA